MGEPPAMRPATLPVPSRALRNHAARHAPRALHSLAVHHAPRALHNHAARPPRRPTSPANPLATTRLKTHAPPLAL